MSTVQSSGKKPIQLQWDAGQVVITPEDQDRFVKEGQWAVNACQGFLAIEKLFEQFKREFLVKLRGWCDQHRDRIYSCYVPFPNLQDIRVFIVTASTSFDFELSDNISDLELEFDKAGWRADIIQLPSTSPDMLLSFFNPDESLQVYGNAPRTPV